MSKITTQIFFKSNQSASRTQMNKGSNKAFEKNKTSLTLGPSANPLQRPGVKKASSAKGFCYKSPNFTQ